MGELKPIGSEKLNGDAKIRRILELTYYQENRTPKAPSEVIKETKSGIYGIVKEKDGYYVKKGINESSLDYIGGLFMKNKNKFSSYNEALKKLEFLTEQEKLTEAIRYTLKQKKPSVPEEMAQTEAQPLPPESGAPPLPPENDISPMVGDDDGVPPESEDPNEYIKIIQKLTGKLQQKMNAYKDNLESENYKAIINQIVSAVDFDKLSDEDKEEIISQFEDDEKEYDSSSFDSPTDQNGEVPSEPQQTNELDGIESLDELINTPLDDYSDDDYYDFTDDDIKFLNRPINKKGEKLAKKDIDQEYRDIDNDDFNMNDDDSMFLRNHPLKSSPSFSDSEDTMFDLDPSELDSEDEYDNIAISDVGTIPMDNGVRKNLTMKKGPHFKKDIYPHDNNDDLDEELSIEDESTRELDLDELTNMVNSSVKETLSKYFR